MTEHIHNLPDRPPQRELRDALAEAMWRAGVTELDLIGGWEFVRTSVRAPWLGGADAILAALPSVGLAIVRVEPPTPGAA